MEIFRRSMGMIFSVWLTCPLSLSVCGIQCRYDKSLEIMGGGQRNHLGSHSLKIERMNTHRSLPVKNGTRNQLQQYFRNITCIINSDNI